MEAGSSWFPIDICLAAPSKCNSLSRLILSPPDLGSILIMKRSFLIKSNFPRMGMPILPWSIVFLVFSFPNFRPFSVSVTNEVFSPAFAKRPWRNYDLRCRTPFNLETAVGRKKDVSDIGVHGEREKFAVTLGFALAWIKNPAQIPWAGFFTSRTHDDWLSDQSLSHSIQQGRNHSFIRFLSWINQLPLNSNAYRPLIVVELIIAHHCPEVTKGLNPIWHN